MEQQTSQEESLKQMLSKEQAVRKRAEEYVLRATRKHAIESEVMQQHVADEQARMQALREQLGIEQAAREEVEEAAKARASCIATSQQLTQHHIDGGHTLRVPQQSRGWERVAQ